MPRSVVLQGTVRCARCQHAPRWCICAGLQPLACPLAVDVLMHRAEVWRPTSTGHLIARALPESRRHLYDHTAPLAPESVLRPDREFWILHPAGEPPPPAPDPATLQVLLLDGSWAQAGRMLRSVDGWPGRRVRLPMTGAGRYWLRSAQEAPERFSTIEALLFLLAALGLDELHAQLRRQFELHVYAGLRGRGRLAEARAYLADSPIRAAFPDLLAALDRPRPRA